MDIFVNVLLSSISISLVLWISKKNPVLAGFVASLPLSTLIILALGKGQSMDSFQLVALAKSILVGVLASLVFFVPFVFAEKLKLSFWVCYSSGFALLTVSYFVHRYVMGVWLS